MSESGLVDRLGIPDFLSKLSFGEKLFGGFIVLMLGVLICLVVLAFIILFVRIMHEARDPKKRKTETVSAPAPIQVQVVSDSQQEDDGEVVAAVTAAITMLRGNGDFRIRSITPADTFREAWAAAGRTEQFKSRRTNKNRR